MAELIADGVARSSDLTPFDPARLQPLHRGGVDRYARFAGLKTAEHLLDFVNRYGFLNSMAGIGGTHFDSDTMRPLDDGHAGERIGDHLASAELVGRVLRAENREGVCARRAAYEELENIYDREDLGQFQLVAKPDRSGFQVIFIASSLMNAIWLQLGGRIGGGIKWGQCRFCDGWFEKGPGTDKRMDAQFCSPAHKVASHRANRDS